MPSVDDLMKLADEAIHAYAAWLAEFTTGDLPSLHVDRLHDEKDAARRKLRAALTDTLGVPPCAAPQPWRGLTKDEIDHAVGELVEYGTEFVAPLYAVVESIERKLMERNAGVAMPGEPSDTERLAMVLHVFEQRDDNMPLTPSERDVLIAFNARGEYTKSMRQRVIDSAIRAARTDGVRVLGHQEESPEDADGSRKDK